MAIPTSENFNPDWSGNAGGFDEHGLPISLLPEESRIKPIAWDGTGGLDLFDRLGVAGLEVFGGAMLGGAFGGGAAGAEAGTAGAGATAGAEGGGAIAAGGGEAAATSSGAVLDPSGLGAGDVAFGSGGSLGLSSSASGGPVLDPTGLGAAEIATSPTTGQVSMLTAASPTMALDPTTAAALGITPDTTAALGSFDTPMGAMPGGAPELGGAFGGVNDNYVGDFATDPNAGMGGSPTSYLDDTAAMLKKLGLTPVQAGLLGLTGYNMTRKPKIPEAGQRLSDSATAGAADARSVISSGGTSAPQWSQQKASIDATIDQQLQQQAEAMLQQAINSGQGADSQVTLQQINKLKNDLEVKRQQLYSQAQGQNVTNALSELGISDQSLAHVTQAQFSADAQARQTAMTTAELALLLGQTRN